MPPAPAAICEKVELQIGYAFKNRNILCEALHTGPQAYFGGRLIQDANEQMALFGHSVMNLVVAERAYDSERPKRLEQMEDHAKRVRTNANLNAKGRKSGLAACLQHEEGEKAITDQMMATAVKAILGAVWRDSRDLGEVKKVMVKLTLFEALSPLDRD